MHLGLLEAVPKSSALLRSSLKMDSTMLKPLKPLVIDEVILEVRKVKAELAKRFNHDVSAMLRDARARQAQSGHPIVDRSEPS